MRRYHKSQKRDPRLFTLAFNNLDNMSPELRLTLKHYTEDVQAGEQRSNGATPQPRRSRSHCGHVYALCRFPCASRLKEGELQRDAQLRRSLNRPTYHRARSPYT